jgi:hypothetical protein
VGKRTVFVRGIEFSSKTSLERHCRGLIKNYNAGDMMSPDDSMFFLSLILERHERPEEKIIAGLEDDVVGIRLRHADGYSFYGESPTNVNHLFVVYACGREVDFSWKKCCSGFKKAHVATSAMRRAIADQVWSYKRLRFATGSGSVTSDASGSPLLWEDARVDHYPVTFAAIRDRFLEKEGVPLGEIATASDPKCGAAMADAALRDRWASFHDVHKTLRLVSARENETSWREEGAIRW